MRYFFFVTALIMVFALVLVSAEKPPVKLTFKAKTGDVVYDHKKHADREKDDCKTCHPKLFPQDSKAPLNFKAGMHKPAVAAKTSCGACHNPGGKAFAPVAGNCNKCHQKPGAKS